MSYKSYFRVSGSWMLAHGTDESGEARVFEVITTRPRVGAAPDETPILILKSDDHPNGEWPVLPIRGHYVEPFTLVCIDGLFSPAPADVQVSGADLCTHGEYPSFGHAQRHAMALNEEIRVAYAAKVPKAMANAIRPGSFVRRLDVDGLPRAKTYRMDLFDIDRLKYAIVDPLNSAKIVWVAPDSMLAIEDGT